MNLLIARACDALVKAYFDRPEKLREISVTAMDQEDLVRAVLLAIYEPNEEMVEEVRIYGELTGPEARACWQGMIDEARR